MANTRSCGHSQAAANRKSTPIMHNLTLVALSLVFLLLAGASVHASEADLAIPDLDKHGTFTILGKEITAGQLLFYGSFVIAGTLGISLYLLAQIKKAPAHKSM